MQRYKEDKDTYDSILPDAAAHNFGRKDTWVSAVDGKRYKSGTAMEDRFVCLSVNSNDHKSFYYCLVGKVSAAAENANSNVEDSCSDDRVLIEIW